MSEGCVVAKTEIAKIKSGSLSCLKLACARANRFRRLSWTLRNAKDKPQVRIIEIHYENAIVLARLR